MRLHVGVGEKVGQGRPIGQGRMVLIGEMLLKIEFELNPRKLSATPFALAICGPLDQLLNDVAGGDHTSAWAGRGKCG